MTFEQLEAALIEYVKASRVRTIAGRKRLYGIEEAISAILLKQVLIETGGNICDTARIMGYNRNTVTKRCKAYGIDKKACADIHDFEIKKEIIGLETEKKHIDDLLRVNYYRP